MSKVLIVNLTRIAQQVDVRHADGKLDSVRIMARSRTYLREGMNVDNRWLQNNPKTLRITNPTVAVVQSTVMPSIPAISTPATTAVATATTTTEA